MKRWKMLSMVCGLLLVLSLIFSGVAAAAAPPDNPGKGPPEIRQIIFIHYPGRGHDESSSGTSSIYSGIQWANPSSVTYRTSLTGDFFSGVDAAFATWHGADSKFSATYDSTSPTSTPGTLDAKWDRKLGTYVGAQNVVGFKKVSLSAIAITYIWYRSDTKEVIEVDTALNSNPAYHWWQVMPTSTKSWPTTGYDSTAYDVDVQNIMTHEAGHWLVLNDLYDKSFSEATMYGYSAEKELKKRSLETIDVWGIQKTYP